jgi:branched-chain amino acid transport system permease protein
VPVVIVPLIGGAAGFAFGLLFGLISTRRAGLVFSMISLGLGELVSSSSYILRSFFGGEEGITTNRAKLAPLFGHRFGPQIEVYYLIAIWCFVCVAMMYALTRTPFGRVCNAVRENPERVEYIGYSAQRVRLIAFCFAAFFAGVAGALAAINFEIMNAQQLGAQQSGVVLLMSYIGGVGYFAGPIVGAVIITFLQITLSDITNAWQLYFGLLFIGFVLFAPDGVTGWVIRHRQAARYGEFRRLAPAYALVAPGLAAGFVGAAMLIEMANRELALAQSEGSVMLLFGLAIDAAATTPWLIAVALLAGGAVMTLRFWQKVTDAWGAINAEQRARGRA